MDELSAKQARNVYDTVIKMLNQSGLKYTEMEGENSVIIRFRGDDMPQSVLFDVKSGAHVLRAQTRLPFTTKKDKMAEMAEAVTRINCMLLIGSYDLDWDGGALIFGISNIYKDCVVGTETAKDMLGWLMTITDKFNEKLLAVNMGFLKPAEVNKD